MARFVFAACLFALPGPALAHAGGQGFVLLLPTGLYIAGGLAAVVLTVAVLAVVPPHAARALFDPWRFGAAAPPRPAPAWISAIGFAVFAVAIAAGLWGNPDPSRNALPVMVWTVLWLHLVLVAGLIFNPWPWVSPWALPMIIARRIGMAPLAALPARLGHAPALISIAAIAAVLLIHPKAADPKTLAYLGLVYYFAHLALAGVFGPGWLARGEAFAVMFACFALLAPIARRAIGLPGWQAIARPRPDTGLAIFIIALLAIGSFDGLSKTFFWLDILGQNPLEFAGRTAVARANGIALGLALPVLVLAYAAALGLGNCISGQTGGFAVFAPTLLPIAFAYHIAHFLPALLIDSQLVPRILDDPFGTGAHLLGLTDWQITTGFLNRLDTVRLLWLTQAGTIVAGHMLAIVMAHRIALDRAGSHRLAVINQLPLAAFMIGYTLFGLWLLASPQGA